MMQRSAGADGPVFPTYLRATGNVMFKARTVAQQASLRAFRSVSPKSALVEDHRAST
jgi:hypothetical protein